MELEVLWIGGLNHTVLVVDRNKEALQTKLSLVMKQLEIWFLKSDLIINTTKTVPMSFHPCCIKPPFKPCILLLNKEIDYRPEVKFLRMCITENLSWQDHICTLCHKLSKTFWLLNLLKIL